MNQQTYTCEICNNSANNKSFIAPEMMFGLKDEFAYIECAECGCLQLKDIPNDLSKYYPQNFYSFQTPSLQNKFLESFFKYLRTKQLIYGNLTAGILISKILRKVYGTAMPIYYTWLRKIQLPLNAKILDVGCGSGKFIFNMGNDGFTNLTGIDPFIQEDIFYDNGVKVFKKYLYELEEKFDFIILNHSFEHMPKPLNVLKELYRLLKAGSYLLIRIPVADSFAWRNYGVNWVQIDAPRHFFLHTTKSMQILAKQVGFNFSDIVFDSNAFQFWGSEQFLKDIPIRDDRSYAVNPEKSIFSKQDIEAFHTKAMQLNQQKDGDAACFYLYKPTGSI